MSDFDAIPDGPHAWIQWKGTDVCMDFHCECGAHCHVDADFCYAVKCPHCGGIFQMGCYVRARRYPENPAEASPYWIENAVEMQPDEDPDL